MNKLKSEEIARNKIVYLSEQGFNSNGLENPLLIKYEEKQNIKYTKHYIINNTKPSESKGDEDLDTSNINDGNRELNEESIDVKIEEETEKLDKPLYSHRINGKDGKWETEVNNPERKNFESNFSAYNSNKYNLLDLKRRDTILYGNLPIHVKGSSLNVIFESKWFKEQNRRYTRSIIDSGKTFFKLRYIKEKLEEISSINNRDIYNTEVQKNVVNINMNIDEELRGYRQLSNTIGVNSVLNEDKNVIKFNSLFLQKLERGIFSFNLKKYEDSFNCLLGSGIVKDEYEFGELLLVITGFDKYIVGDFLSKEKYPNKDKKVLHGFVKSMDFRHLKFLDGLRFLLSRLNLPKEAGLILEIVDIFSTIFFEDNKETKHYKDTTAIYLLTSSVLALNTMFSRSDIANMKVMKKEDFIKMNKDVSVEILGNLYDDLKLNKLDIIHDYNELIYRRLSVKAQTSQDFFEKLNKVNEPNKDPNVQMIDPSNGDGKGEVIIKMLKSGEIFIKYGKYGDPHPRNVKLSEDEKKLYWYSSGGCNIFKKMKFIEISDIKDVYIGASASKIFEKYKIPPDYDSCCFSIVSGKRSLDLRKDDESVCKKWYQGIKYILRKNRSIFDLKKNKSNMKSFISDIWINEILPNWHIYRKFVITKEKGNLIEGFSSLNMSNKDMNKKNKEKLWKLLTKQNSKQNEKILDDKDRSEFLFLWTHGIPDWLRKKLWPLVIGNESVITENLFNFYLKQIESINFKEILQYYQKNDLGISNKDELENGNPNLKNSPNFETLRKFKHKIHVSDDPIFNEIINDIYKITLRLEAEIIKNKFDVNEFMDDLFKTVRVFTLIRPDITYSKQISYLSAILLLNSDNYYSAFVCLINFAIPGFMMKFLTRDELYVKYKNNN